MASNQFLWNGKEQFPKDERILPLCKDSPYKYRIHVKFEVTKDFTSDPSITYYRISQKGDEDNTLEIITDGPYPELDNEEIFNMIMSSYNLNGKESDNVSITSTGFDMTLTSRHSGANMPLTSVVYVVYDDLSKNFKALFEK